MNKCSNLNKISVLNNYIRGAQKIKFSVFSSIFIWQFWSFLCANCPFKCCCTWRMQSRSALISTAIRFNNRNIDKMTKSFAIKPHNSRKCQWIRPKFASSPFGSCSAAIRAKICLVETKDACTTARNHTINAILQCYLILFWAWCNPLILMQQTQTQPQKSIFVFLHCSATSNNLWLCLWIQIIQFALWPWSYLRSQSSSIWWTWDQLLFL